MAPVLALDLGGTKLAAAVVDEAGRILGRGRVPSPRGAGAEALYEALVTCAATALRGADTMPGDLAGVGVSAAGPMRWPAGVVSPLNQPDWRDFPLRDRLLAEFDARTVLVHNDAVGIVVGEHWKGAGVGTSNLLGVTVSTGVGGGLILDGRLYHGTTGNAGHVGHVVVEPDGPPCACGGRGCLEAVASGPRAVAHALAAGWRPDGVADGVALARSATAGDPVAARTVERAGRALGRALASTACLLDLEMAAVVGGFSRSGPVFWDGLRAAFATHAGMAFAAACRIVPGALGADAGLLGAAAFVLRPDRYGWEAGPWPAGGSAPEPSATG